MAFLVENVEHKVTGRALVAILNVVVDGQRHALDRILQVGM